MQSKINKLLLTLIIILSFFFTYILNYQNHWSGSLEDFTQIYNGLILNSGIKAEFHDHPGHSLIYLISLWLNFLDLLSIIKYSSFFDIYNEENLKDVLTEIVAYAKFLNLIFLYFFLIIFYKFLKIFSKDKTLILFFLLIFLCSDALLTSINMIKAEFLSAISIFTSFYFLTEFLNKKPKRKYIFFSGFFLCLSIFAKFQAIFVIFFLPLLFLYKQKKLFKIESLKFENKHILKLSLTTMLMCIFLIYIKYVKGVNYFFLPTILFYYFLLIYWIERLFFKNKIKLIFANYFLFGFYFCVLFLVAFKPFHTNNLNVIVNGFGQASMFVQGKSPYSSDINIFFDILLLSISSISSIFKIFFLKFNLLTIASLAIILFVFISILSKDKKRLIFCLGTIFVIFTICFFFSVRPRPHYTIYVAPIIFSSLFILIYSSMKKNIIYSIVVLSLFINLTNVYNKISYSIYETKYDQACVREINTEGYMYWWHKQIDKKFLKKACQL